MRVDDRLFVSRRSPLSQKEAILSKATKTTQAQAEAKFKRKEVQTRDANKAVAEYEAASIAMREKTTRLKKLRLAKEDADRTAAEQEPTAEKPKKRL